MPKKKRSARYTQADPGKKTPLPQRPEARQKVTSWAGRAESFFYRFALPFEIFAVILLVAAGFFFRMQALPDWKKAEAQTFYDGQPLHTTFDAYFYLTLARDLLENTYNPIDEKRGVPDSPPRPMPPPLLSLLAAETARITDARLSWIGAVLPAVLAGFLAVPMYLLMRYYSGWFAGFSASLLSLLYPFYIYRSGFGRFDTDCLNCTFILISAYLFLRFALISGLQRYLYFAIALINYGLFLWWWDQTPAVVTSITFLPFAVALTFYYRPKKKEAAFFFGSIALGLLLIMGLKGPGIFINMGRAIINQFLYISKDASGAFPNIGVTISEQSIPPLDTIIGYTTGSMPAFMFASAGVVLLVYRRFKSSLFLGSYMLLSFLAFTYANRFIIFLVPMLGIGAGYLLGELWKVRRKFMPLFAICPALLLYFAVPLYIDNVAKPQYPKLTAATVEGMDTAMQQTPGNAVIWAWWDNGYALTYFARRATMNDGSIHSGERTYCNALPLAFSDFRLAANFMHFYVIHGMEGINRFCSALKMSRNEAMEVLKALLAAGPDGALPILLSYAKQGKLKGLFWGAKKKRIRLFAVSVSG